MTSLVSVDFQFSPKTHFETLSQELITCWFANIESYLNHVLR